MTGTEYTAHSAAQQQSTTARQGDLDAMLDHMFDARQLWLQEAHQADKKGDTTTARQCRMEAERLSMSASNLLTGHPVSPDTGNHLFIVSTQKKGN